MSDSEQATTHQADHADTLTPSATPTTATHLATTSSPTDPLLSPPSPNNGSSSSLSAAEKDDAAASSGAASVPDDKVHLTLLLVSGRRQTFEFGPKDTIAQVKKSVFEKWPKEWADETPVSTSSLNIVYLGRFLDNSTTLEANKISAGQATIVHLTIKNVQAYDVEDSKADSAPRCKLCIIL